ncbi:glycosyltransferase family 1 protein [Candidatus Parcubacteria bacterium]|jgi:glycosyltransferase involved in cell wall biosynthesis|nr:MAG: glycosyltransferase family 1 protein [Candidatus Parcubacteria bacterium]
MRLGVDLRCLNEGQPGGIAVYAQELLPRLSAALSTWDFLGLLSGLKIREIDLPFSIRRINWPNKLLNFSLISAGYPKLENWLNEAEFFFAPTPKYLALKPKTKFVLTVHDLSFVEHPEFFTSRQRFWHRFLKIQKLIERADRLIAVSEHTAADIENLVKGSAQKIRVVYSGADHTPLAPQPRPKNWPEKYILAFAPSEPRKNLVNLLKAHARIYPKLKVPLVLVGTNCQPGPGVIIQPYLSKNEHWRALANAEVLVYPSLYEGFGFPPLEAFRLSVPALAAFSTSLPEVLGNAALLVDPFDPNDLARGLETILQKDNLRQEFIRRGHAQVQKFKWSNCAEQTARVFLELT